MKATESKPAFEELLGVLSPDMTRLLPEDGITGMVNFYQMKRAEECDMENDGDMLLFQWGTFNFTGKNEFQINITRQFILQEDEPYQLSLTFYFESNENNAEIKSGNFWCNNPGEISDFVSNIESNEAYRIFKRNKSNKVELTYDQC